MTEYDDLMARAADYLDVIEPESFDGETFYATHPDEDTPLTIMAFFPNGTVERVLFTSPEYEVVDYGTEATRRDENDPEWLGSYHTEADAEAALQVARDDADDERDDDDGWGPRFQIRDLSDYELPEWFKTARVEVGYHRSDGWRGYTTFTAPEGWVEYAGGWVTGYPDETTRRKLDAAEIHNGLYDGTLTAPVPILWCFGYTSNVFSQISDVFVPDGAGDIVDAWLDGLDSDVDAEAFNRAFS